MRLQHDDRERRAAENDPQPSTSHAHADRTREEMNQKMEQVKAMAHDLILEAEQYKATLQKPKGMVFNQINPNVGSSQFSSADQDDEFFHISCHID